VNEDPAAGIRDETGITQISAHTVRVYGEICSVMMRGGLSPRPLPSWSLHLAASAVILLATLLTTAGVVFVTPPPGPASPTPTCVPGKRG